LGIILLGTAGGTEPWRPNLDADLSVTNVGEYAVVKEGRGAVKRQGEGRALELLPTLPAGFANPREFATAGQVAQAHAAGTKKAVVSARTATQAATVVEFNFGEFAFGGSLPTAFLFENHCGLSQERGS
jgi:hypothetical protein